MTIVAGPYKEGVLVNKIGAGMAEELKTVTDRLASVADKLEAPGQPKAKQAKKPAEGTEASEATAQAALTKNASAGLGTPFLGVELDCSQMSSVVYCPILGPI